MDIRSVVIVQARMGSSRLPGKVLKELRGRTVLRRVLERCSAIEGIEKLCCAVPSHTTDDPVADEAARCGALVIRGSESDVLERYHQAAQECRADVILRVTSDCPVLDPEIAASVLRLVTSEGADYACNNMPPTWPHGLDCEAVRYRWLEKAAREAVLPSEREHVTPFIRNHRSVRKLVWNGPGGDIVQHRWTLDTEQDLIFLKALFEEMPEGKESYAYRYPLAIVEKTPSLMALNRGQEREAGLNKSLAEDAVFRSRV